MTQAELFPARVCPIRRVPFADGEGYVLQHECGRYAVNIWPCFECTSHPGDLSVPAVRAFRGGES